MCKEEEFNFCEEQGKSSPKKNNLDLHDHETFMVDHFNYTRKRDEEHFVQSQGDQRRNECIPVR